MITMPSQMDSERANNLMSTMIACIQFILKELYDQNKDVDKCVIIGGLETVLQMEFQNEFSKELMSGIIQDDSKTC